MKQVDPISRMSRYMIWGVWILVLGLLVIYFDAELEKQYNPNQKISIRSENGQQALVLKRNRFGHYVASGLINGYPVVFILDTGATDISIPESLASKIGLKKGRRVIYQTANGNAVGYRTRLDSVTLGNITLRDLPASINPNVSDMDVLLGMSFLKHLDFSQKGDTLIISPPERL